MVAGILDRILPHGGSLSHPDSLFASRVTTYELVLNYTVPGDYSSYTSIEGSEYLPLWKIGCLGGQNRFVTELKDPRAKRLHGLNHYMGFLWVQFKQLVLLHMASVDIRSFWLALEITTSHFGTDP
ncbi:hypothetical protein N7478_000285 [Penicillium angulare]|uniref:uncharacterized protein n=1 Tax=Penicillium angulare TaxID=116970 RepID=UPI0025415B72|nr:uncharacterized protein N7478_000285 [Penicillium angulare]KAJ5291034.1 hypothetical protein N7478_000285 [Penicillium angulare]